MTNWIIEEVVTNPFFKVEFGESSYSNQVDLKLNSINLSVSQSISKEAFKFNKITTRLLSRDNGYNYSGFDIIGVINIYRSTDGVCEIAENVTDLTTDWENRENLTYIII